MQIDQTQLTEIVKDHFSKYPPVVRIPQLAEIFREKEPTIRSRIRQGAFPIKVISEPGSEQYVLLIDLVSFFLTGKRQVPLPPSLAKRKPGKRRGRPTKAEEIAKRHGEGNKDD